MYLPIILGALLSSARFSKLKFFNGRKLFRAEQLEN
jgi:hypothetical protein